ncbi:MAG: hypothetical protein IPO29_14820 [Anaerolineae bacterium]|nr:hypothetical protein [Anaerolineae bacterium]
MTAKPNDRPETELPAELDFASFVPVSIGGSENLQTDIPRIAKDAALMSEIENAVSRIPTRHRLVRGDARELGFIER